MVIGLTWQNFGWKLVKNVGLVSCKPARLDRTLRSQSDLAERSWQRLMHLFRDIRTFDRPIRAIPRSRPAPSTELAHALSMKLTCSQNAFLSQLHTTQY